MNVTLIQRPTEVALGRKTILLDGVQIGYFHGPKKPVLLTRHVDEETAEFVRGEVARLESCDTGAVAVPPETPPEWLQEEAEEPSPIVLP